MKLLAGGLASANSQILKPMPELDHLMQALFLVALLLYLVPAVVGQGEGPRWLRRGAILALGLAIAIAVTASLLWFLR